MTMTINAKEELLGIVSPTNILRAKIRFHGVELVLRENSFMQLFFQALDWNYVPNRHATKENVLEGVVWLKDGNWLIRRDGEDDEPEEWVHCRPHLGPDFDKYKL